MMKHEFVDHIITENTGGGTMLDLIVLQDGRVLGVNEECVVAYSSLHEFYSGETAHCPYVYLPERGDPLKTPILCAADARAFLAHLCATGREFHPDDPADSIVECATGRRVFSDEEAECADARMAECFAYIDPYESLLSMREDA